MGTGRTFEQAFEENFMGELELFVGVVDLFEAQYKTNAEKLRVAIEAEDRKGVKEMAHKIKGSVSHFHHDEPVAIAQNLEANASSMSKDLMMANFRKLEEKLDDLKVDLKAIAQRLQSGAAA